VRAWCVTGSVRLLEPEGGGGGGGGLCSPMANVPLSGSTGGGTPVLVSSKTSRRSRQRDDAASGREGQTPHRGGSDGVSCAHGDRLQVSSSAGEPSDRSVVDMKYGLGLGECALQSPPREENLARGMTLGFDNGGGNVLFLFRHKNSLFRHNQFSTLFFSMKEAESRGIVIVSCIIDFKDKQV
jgi:hypothetical protein